MNPPAADAWEERAAVGAQRWAAPGYFALLVVGTAMAVDGTVPSAYGTPKSYLVPVAVTGAVVLWAAWGVWRRRGIRISVLDVLLAVGVLFGVLTHPRLLARSDALAIPMGFALVGVTFLARQLPSPVVAGSEDGDGPAPDLVHAIWICGVMLALPALRQSLFSSSPLLGSVGSVNGLGAMLALALVAVGAAGLWVRKTGETSLRRGLYVAAAVCGVALLVNGSRGAILAAAVGGGTLLFLAPRSDGTPLLRSRRTGWVVLAAVAFLVSMVVGLTLLDPGSSGGRLLVWRMTLPMIADHPLVGVGPGQFGAEYPAYQAAFWAEGTNLRWAYKASELIHPHSDLLLKTAETGMPGGALWVAVWLGAVVALFRNILQKGPRAGVHVALLALLLTLLVHGAVDSMGLVVPVAVTAHLILGLVPAPEVTLRPGRGAWAAFLIVVTVGGTWGLAQVVREYRGHRLWLQGQTAVGGQAVDRLRAATLLLPDHARLESELGTVLTAVGPTSEGIRILEHSLDLGAPPAHRLTLGAAYLSVGDADGAEAQARAYLAIFPDQLRPRLLLARSFLARGEREAARRELVRCIRRETTVRSAAVDAVASEAMAVWEAHYDEPPPRSESEEAVRETPPSG